MGFAESGFPDKMRKPVLGSQRLENLRYGINNNSCISMPSFSTITSNSLAGFGTKFSSSTQIHDALAVTREPNSRRCSVENLVLHALEPLVRAKRVRITILQSQIPVCQVLDCNKDLSSSKDYHKRHRVCDLHSKAAVVIVNGLQQRFCQQCSRFHLLPEFDKGKRSCRKRLAGHNQRRRKPQLGSLFLGTDSSTSTMLSPKIFEGGFFGEQGMRLMNCSRHVKLERELCQIPRIEVPTKFRLLHPKSLFHLRYPSENCPGGPFSVQVLSADSNSSSAPSLLSAQSQKLLSNSSCISMACPIFQGNQHTNLLDQSVNKSSYGVAQASFPVVPDIAFSIDTEITRNMHAQNLEYYPSPAGANTVDLIQLSLHLQRIEDQKYSNQVKLEKVSSATLLHHEEDRNIESQSSLLRRFIASSLVLVQFEELLDDRSVIYKDVYDVTTYLEEHPGGDDILPEATGKDATDEFEDAGHSKTARELMGQFFIGELDPTIPAIPKMEIVSKKQKLEDLSDKILNFSKQYWVDSVAVVGISVVVGFVFLRRK